MENRIKVLIADGSEAFCGHLKNELQQLDGYDLVGTAADGEEAVRLLEATKPDILVLDLMLAKRDGISVLRYACRFVNDELQTLGKKRGQLWGPSS